MIDVNFNSCRVNFYITVSLMYLIEKLPYQIMVDDFYHMNFNSLENSVNKK